MAAKIVMEPIFEADFQPSSYGFRPKRSAQQALEAIRVAGNRVHNFVVDADAKAHRLRVTGTPLWDPLTGAPFALARHPEKIAILPALRRSATLVTSRTAPPLLSAIFRQMGEKVNVVGVNKDVGCLITIEDFMDLDLKEVRETVIIPGRTLAHEKEIKKALSRDGRDRIVARGPDQLTVDGEMSISMTAE